jgi:RimJ/RimL family protein N-acetyltransferase
VRILGDPQVERWLRPSEPDPPPLPERVREHLAQHAAQLEDRGFCLWWWREGISGELVGRIGLNSTDVEGEQVVEVGWAVAPERWGEGFASEAAEASLAWGFERLGLDEIVAFALPHNAASRRVMEKLGMAYDRPFDRMGLEHVLYRLSAGR